MTLTVFLAVIAAAAFHATWNAGIKSGSDRFGTMLIMTMCQGLLGLAMVVVFPLPAAAAWPWLIASGAIHTAYKLFLTAAYDRGDLSRVYPIARGAAPMIVAAAGLFLLTDPVSGRQYFGIFLIALGIMSTARGIWSSKEARSLLPFALASATCTAAYSIVDGIGARIALTASGFTGWMFFFDGIFFSAVATIRDGTKTFRRPVNVWKIGAISGVLSLMSYWIVIWAMTQAPIQLVTALRESSVLFAMLIGIIWLKEPAQRSKIIAAVLILAGMVALKT